MSILNLLLVTVLVGLTNGEEVTLTDAQFTGFIQAREDGRIVLRYQTGAQHGALFADSISRIDFGYRRGQPFPLTVTLRSGQTLQIASDHRNFLRLRGRTDNGEVTISHPDPLSSPIRLTTRAANRSDDLTIRFLEFRE